SVLEVRDGHHAEHAEEEDDPSVFEQTPAHFECSLIHVWRPRAGRLAEGARAIPPQQASAFKSDGRRRPTYVSRPLRGIATPPSWECRPLLRSRCRPCRCGPSVSCCR